MLSNYTYNYSYLDVTYKDVYKNTLSKSRKDIISKFILEYFFREKWFKCNLTLLY